MRTLGDLRVAACALLSGALALGVACTPAPSAGWTDQLAPAGPCYAVNLLDGLSEASTQELHDTYTCLNRQGLLTAFGGLDAAMDAPTRSGDPAGVELARGLNAALGQDLDVFGLFGTAREALELEGAPLERLVRAGVELLYARSWEQLRSGTVSLQPASSLDAGVIRPLLPAVRSMAGVALDDQAALDALVDDALDSAALLPLVHTAAALGQPKDAQLDQTLEQLPAHLGEAIERARDATNDRWAESSGDSLRDLAQKLLVDTGNDGRVALEHLADPLRELLPDTGLRARVRGAVAQLDREDRLEPLPAQLLYLAQVDVDGGSLSGGEDSALVALLRLVHDADGPMRCSVDLIVTELTLDIDNLAVELLETLAEQDPDTVEGGVGLLGAVLGWGVSESVLNSVADSGVCDILDRQLVSDLGAIDRFNDPQSADLLVALLDVLGAFADGEPSRVPELVDVLSTVYAFGAAEPLEEVLRDLGTAELVYDALELLPVLLTPEAYLDRGGLPPGVDLLDFEALWDLLGGLVALRGSGQSAVEELSPLLRAAMAQEGTWTALGNLAGLLQRADSEAAHLGDALPGLLALDPELALLQELAPALVDPAVLTPLLRVAESPEVMDALGQAELTAEGPLPFVARMVVGDTWEALLAWLDLALGALGG